MKALPYDEASVATGTLARDMDPNLDIRQPEPSQSQ
jgi:hypothetical protein